MSSAEVTEFVHGSVHQNDYDIRMKIARTEATSRAGAKSFMIDRSLPGLSIDLSRCRLVCGQSELYAIIDDVMVC